MTGASLHETRAAADAILDEISTAIVGKRDVLELVLLGMLARGHILLEDYPGLAKTLIARCFASVVGINFNRIQFTPDLLPADITGSLIYDQRAAAFEFRPGPLFTNLLLGDEINRAPPKTQAALLEAMQEGQVTVEDTTHVLEEPFVVIATQNPIEYEGTYPLPEAQLDRFMLRVGVGYPERDEEWEILKRRLARGKDEPVLRRVVDAEALMRMQDALEEVYVSESTGRYIVEIVDRTRKDADVAVGASPRGALAVLKLARGRAVLSGRDFVTPDDIKSVAVAALGHRLTLRPELWVKRISGRDVIARVLGEVPTPRAETEESIT
ncbi:MAG: AAA family ATPase [Actinomycetota bacterium]